MNQKVKKTLQFQSEEVQARMEALMTADPTLSMTAAVRMVFENMEKENAVLKAEIEELSRKHSEAVANLEYENGRLQEGLNDTSAELGRALSSLETAPPQELFADLSVLPPEAAEYLKTVRNEMLAAQLHPSTAEWIMHLLNVVQNLPGKAAGYVPENGEKVNLKWLTHE